MKFIGFRRLGPLLNPLKPGPNEGMLWPEHNRTGQQKWDSRYHREQASCDAGCQQGYSNNLSHTPGYLKAVSREDTIASASWLRSVKGGDRISTFPRPGTVSLLRPAKTPLSRMFF